MKNHIDAEGLSQSQAAKLFGVTQPRVSDLLRGKITLLFKLDTLRSASIWIGFPHPDCRAATLVNMIAAAGLHVEVKVAEAA